MEKESNPSKTNKATMEVGPIQKLSLGFADRLLKDEILPLKGQKKAKKESIVQAKEILKDVEEKLDKVNNYQMEYDWISNHVALPLASSSEDFGLIMDAALAQLASLDLSFTSATTNVRDTNAKLNDLSCKIIAFDQSLCNSCGKGKALEGGAKALFELAKDAQKEGKSNQEKAIKVGSAKGKFCKDTAQTIKKEITEETAKFVADINTNITKSATDLATATTSVSNQKNVIKGKKAALKTLQLNSNLLCNLYGLSVGDPSKEEDCCKGEIEMTQKEEENCSPAINKLVERIGDIQEKVDNLTEEKAELEAVKTSKKAKRDSLKSCFDAIETTNGIALVLLDNFEANKFRIDWLVDSAIETKELLLDLVNQTKKVGHVVHGLGLEMDSINTMIGKLNPPLPDTSPIIVSKKKVEECVAASISHAESSVTSTLKALKDAKMMKRFVKFDADLLPDSEECLLDLNTAMKQLITTIDQRCAEGADYIFDREPGGVSYFAKSKTEYEDSEKDLRDFDKKLNKILKKLGRKEVELNALTKALETAKTTAGCTTT